MPNLKDIRRRIKSVKSTQKITQAMKMVAAAKVKRAENRVKANRPYSQALMRLFGQIYEPLRTQARQLEGSRYADLLVERPIKKVGIVILAGDRGLCGSYNATILKQAGIIAKEFEAQGMRPKLFLVGNKAIKGLRDPNTSLLGNRGNISAAPHHHDAQDIAKVLVQAYHKGEIDAIQVLYTRFVSMISYKVTLKPIFPMRGILRDIDPHLLPPDHLFESHIRPNQEHIAHSEPEILLEPDAVQVLDTLVPLYLGNQVYNALLESAASELAARMTAMSNAAKNAGEMITKLSLIYNKARQASITQEILEIVSGANAL